MDRLDELAIFVAILDAGSLAAASRRLRRSPPAVTRALANLEERVGARLVERTTRRLAATEAGRTLADQARRMLADYDAALRTVSGTPLRGLLRITAPLVFGRRYVAPVVLSFLDANPGMQIELVLDDRHMDLIDESLDVAVRIGRLADSNLVLRRVGAVRRVIVASPEYIARRGAPTDPYDLSHHDVVFTSGRPMPPEWRFLCGGRERTFRLTPRLIVNEVDSMLLAVKGGRGIGRALSYQVDDELKSGSLVRLLEDFELPALPVQLVVPALQHMPSKVRVFLDHAVPLLSGLRAIQG